MNRHELDSIFFRFDVSAYHEKYTYSDCSVYERRDNSGLQDPLQPLVYDDDCTGAAISLLRALIRSNDYMEQAEEWGLDHDDAIGIDTSTFGAIIKRHFWRRS